MLRAAVVRYETNLVENVIVADAAIHAAPNGCFLVNTESPCEIGWAYDSTINDFIDPSPPSLTPDSLGAVADGK